MAAMDSESPTTIHRGERVAKGPIAWMAGHSVAANLMMFVFLVGGLIYAGQIKKEVFPDFELDYVTISVPYPGASPEEVERGVVLAIEEAVQGLDGIKEITATAGEGSASVTVEIIEGKSIERLAQDIQSEVDRITSFPEEAEEPRVTIAQRKRSVVSLALYGAQGEKVLRETAEQVRDRLLQSPQITQVEFSGVRDYEIDISVPQAQLRAYGLSLEQIAGTIRRAAVELPGGPLRPKVGMCWCE
jgi:multidrug efflux pump subunit AcrB